MTRLLVGQSYFLRFDPKLWSAMQPYPPLGSLYAAAFLRRAGHDVVAFDAMLAESVTGWIDAIERAQPDVAVLFDDNFNYLSKMCLLAMRRAGLAMLDAARDHGIPAVVCNSDATDHARLYLDHGADYVVVGEGEATLVELVDHLATSSGQAPALIAGLVFRGADGSLVQTAKRPNLRDLDTVPFPAWDLIDIDRYRRAWSRHGRFSMNLVSTRGCPYHCNWCAKPIWGQRYAVRSAENVVDEIAWLQATYHPQHLSFADDIFGLKPGWLRAFADEIRRRQCVVPFKCLSRADLLLRDGDVDALRDAGCEMVWMGAESGSQSILDAMEKGTRVEQILEASSRLRAAGIKVGYFLQFGYPGEQLADIRATRRLVQAGQPDDIGISVSYPLPGTPFYDRVAAELGAQRNWLDSSDLAMLYHGPYSTRFYRRLHRVVHTEFRLRRAAGTLAPHTHVWRAVRRRGSFGRARDAVALPLERSLLTLIERRDRIATRLPEPGATTIPSGSSGP